MLWYKIKYANKLKSNMSMCDQINTVSASTERFGNMQNWIKSNLNISPLSVTVN